MINSISYTKTQLKHLPLAINLYGIDHHQEPVVRHKPFGQFQIFLCKEGSGEFIINNRKYVLSQGQFFLLYPNESHSYKAISDDWIVSFIAFSGNNALEILRSLKLNCSGIYHSNNIDIFYELLENITSLKSSMQKKNDKSNINMPLSKCLYSFLLDFSASTRFINSSASATANETIQIIIAYMEDHFNEVISLDELANEVNLSKGYLCDMFKKEMGQTIIQYLNSIRVVRARILLLEHPDMKINEIAKNCGFESSSYFGEMFKKITNMTPGEYRIK